MYIMQQMGNPDATHYNIPLVFRIRGNLNRSKLEQSFQFLLQRHEILRTSFHLAEGELVQQVHEGIQWRMEKQQAAESEIPGIIEKFIRPFRLDEAPLFRARLVRIDREDHLLMTDVHHIAADGVSVNLLLTELFAFYRDEIPESPKLRYGDFALFQQTDTWKRRMETQEEYGSTFINKRVRCGNSNSLPPKIIPKDCGGNVGSRIPRTLSESVRHMAQEMNVTQYMLLLAAYKLFLHKMTDAEEVVVGMPVDGRPYSDLEQTVGMFVNTLALRTRIDKGESFRSLVRNVREHLLDAYENGDYPFDQLVERLGLSRSTRRHPLFDTMFMLQNMEMDSIEVSGLSISAHPWSWNHSKFDMTWSIVETDGFQLSVEYSTELFQRETIHRMINRYLHILKQVVSEPDGLLETVELITEEEKEEILHQFNNTAQPYPDQHTIHQLFEEQVQQTPEQPAVVFSKQRLTYRELNERSNRLAHTLRGRGVGRNDLVGLLTGRSPELIIGMLGILKSGGAYVPIDPDYPSERVRYMLRDSGIRHLIVDRVEHVPPDYDGEWILTTEESTATPATNPERVNHPDDLAYVIYTSGSTGEPKGVMITHRGVCNLHVMAEAYGIQRGTRVLQFASPSFDAAVEEVFHTLLNGGTLYLRTSGMLTDPEGFLDELEALGIETVTLPPSLLQILPQRSLPSLRTLISAGEALSPDVAERWGRNRRLINAYGPTEATVCTTMGPVRPGERIRIGTPVANKWVYILNRFGQLQPTGVPGELCIGGEGLARGYLGRFELTREKFVDNPFGPGKMYRTGDRARWLADGNIEYLGRMDEQVKIRGHRVEPEEIRYHLQEHPSVKQAVVVPWKDGEECYLAAYVVPLGEGKADTEQWRQFLKGRLPDYMIPSFFRQMESLPISPNGKLLKQALPNPRWEEGVEKSPLQGWEREVATIYEEVLGQGNLGPDAHFFECGGHSLKGLELALHLNRKFGLHLTLQDVYMYPRIREMAQRIRGRKQSDDTVTPVFDLEKLQGRLTSLPQQDRLPPYADPEKFEEETLWMGSGGIQVPATLTYPKGAGPFPAVILVPGDGEQDRDASLFAQKPFRDLAVGLAAEGFVVIRYEKRTKKAIFGTDYTIQDEFVPDALEALDLLHQHGKVDGNSIFLVGHCRGGWMIPEIVQCAGKQRVAGAVLLSAPDPCLDGVEMLYRKALPGVGDEEMAQIRSELDQLENPRLKKEEFRLAPGLKWWRSLKGYKPVQFMEGLRIPLLIMQGGRDLNVDFRDFEMWKELMGDKDWVRYRYYPRLNHAYVEGEGSPSIEEYLHPGHIPKEVISDLAKWMNRSAVFRHELSIDLT